MASPSAKSNEAPHATAPASGGSGLPASSPDDIIANFSNSTGVSSSGKPDNAFTGNYGPMAGAYQPRQPGQAPAQGAPITKTVQEMINEYYMWDDKQKQTLRNQLALVDKSALTASDSQIANIWGDYVQQSANYFSAGATLTPWDILSKDISTRGGPEASKAGTRTQTTSDTSLTSRIDAEAVFQSAAHSLLGRDPTPQESAAFQKLLNSQEAANPTTATVTTTTDAEGNTVASNRISQGGIGAGGAALLAKQQAQANPEFGAYQAATTYTNALMQLVNGR